MIFETRCVGFVPILIAAILSVSCSDDSSNSGPLDVPGEDISKPANLVTVISGTVEGEYYREARVDLIELSETLSPTGRAVSGGIDTMGRYSVIIDSFTSPYAELTVSGKAELPCVAEKYETKISVVVDLAKESSASLNLFSYFASERAKALVKEEKLDFAKAWTQAENEVFKWFAFSSDKVPLKSLHFDGDSSSPELHSISLLFERFSLEILHKGYVETREAMAKTFAKGGDLSKDSAFYTLGAAAFSYDEKIPKGSWCATGEKLSVDNTTAMSYFHVLWPLLMGLNACTDSLKGESFWMENPENAKGNVPLIYGTKDFYLCDGKEWISEGLDVAQAKYGNAEDAAMEEGKYVYDKESGWRYATQNEIRMTQSCVTSKEGQIINLSICKNGDWIELPEDSVDVMGVDCSEDGKTFKGKATRRDFVCMAGKAYVVTDMDKKVGDYCNASTRGDTAYVGYSPFICKDTWEYVSPDSLDEWMKDSRDGQKYPIVAMGRNRWMATNLRYTDSLTTPNIAGNIWCYDDYAPACSGKIGPFYSWTAMMDLPGETNPDSAVFDLPHRGICPEGWHVPSKAEWDSLFAFAEKFGPEGKLAHSLMGSTSWSIASKQPLNTFGFDVRPSGRHEPDGTYKNDATHAYFWFVTQEEKREQYYYFWNSKDEIYSGKSSSLDLGLNVRCVEDEK